MSILRPNRRKDRKTDPQYKAWISQFCCIVCWLMGTGEWEEFCGEPHYVFGYASNQLSRTEVAHVGERGLGQKCSDLETIPLCAEHHREGKYSAHKLQKKFFQFHGLNREGIIKALNARYEKEAA